MQRMTQAQFESLTHAARTLSADEYGVKVLVTPDDRVIKLFRRKRLLSSALWFPYARRFDFAARELAARGIPAVRVEQVARVPSLRRDLVVYRRLDGATLREALASNHDNNGERLLPLLASFLAMLHERGVYFRAVHFGNVLVQASEEGQPRLALIDVSESRFRRGPLSPTLRARNLRPLVKYAEDRSALQGFGLPRFVDRYLESARLSERAERRFRRGLTRVIPSSGSTQVDPRVS
jgi:hypothetical protein